MGGVRHCPARAARLFAESSSAPDFFIPQNIQYYPVEFPLPETIVLEIQRSLRRAFVRDSELFVERGAVSFSTLDLRHLSQSKGQQLISRIQKVIDR